MYMQRYMDCKMVDGFSRNLILNFLSAEKKIPSDLAGATFMAISTSSPELFTNMIGTFMTEGDLGVGTIVGKLVIFNKLCIDVTYFLVF
jgi:Ca2+/Na+ antiporter